MCYTGHCKYEGYSGTCGFGFGKFPPDAGCVIADQIDDDTTEEEIAEIIRKAEDATGLAQLTQD